MSKLHRWLPGWPCIAILLAALSVSACSPRFTPLLNEPLEVEAAHRIFAAAAPAAIEVRSAADAEALLTAVFRRVADAAQPLCVTDRGRSCSVQVEMEMSAEVRAGITEQGRVTMSLGMLSILRSDDEIAAVIGHELGHHLASHSELRRARRFAGGAAAATLLGALVPLGGIAGWAIAPGAALLGSRAGQLVFSKDEEREADYVGAYLIARAGYDLDRAGLVWVRLTRGGPDETVTLLDSHPAGPERLAAWRRTTAEIRASSDLLPRRSRQ